MELASERALSTEIFNDARTLGEVIIDPRVADCSNNSMLSFLHNMHGDLEIVLEALVVTDKRGECELCMPSGSVSEAGVPPVSVAGVHRYRFNGAWYQAIDKEMRLVESKTVTVLDNLPKGEKDFESRWVLQYKSDKDGPISKTKARLVAQGFIQREGVDYFQTSAPTHAAASVKIVMAVANELNYKVNA